ncbi:hypothetical protein [Thermosulfurimonas sp. F29]|uniref:hypothetical protein n=1 Tax=Thermosulfurimonas sp. F29 TaxID=2867247 RepID=UPI001C832B5A|nr:hypothetical protein [Thermosulfurimonas sp. F29]MBX6423138.1 hypothetical protein [Thermosulfurimonas sp. F29]
MVGIFRFLLVVGVLLLAGGLCPLRAASPDSVSNRQIYAKLLEMDRRLANLEKRQDILEARYESLEKRLEDFRAEMNGRFQDLRAEMNGKFDDLRGEMNGKFEDLRAETNAKFDLLSSRLDDLTKYMGWMVAGIFVLVAAVVGLIIWDRRTAARLAAREAERSFRAEVEKVLNVLRERARTDGELAAILRNYGLL